jgi:alpha-N-acetylglucosamine transferase
MIQIVHAVRPKAKVKYYAKRWPMTFSKLHIWGVESDRAIYIDADCLAVQPFWNALAYREFDRVAACWVVRGSNRFNAGMMVIKPSKQLHEKFIDDVTNGDPALTHVAGSDQSYHNLQFPNWTQVPDRFNYRWWANKPGNLAIAHIRPHPWGKSQMPSPHYKKIADQWRACLARA